MEVSNRFKNLIDPIRDIASNWDIDIADELTNYLEELEELKISFDGGNTNLNFAEAALVISGSTAIYSKKVEYLYQLVMKALDFISSQRNNNDNNSSNANAGSKQKSVHISIAEDERMLFSNDISALLVDDVVEEAQHIDLEDIVIKDESNKRINSLLGHKNDDTKSSDFSRSSVLLMHSLLQEDQGGGSLKMSSCRMDVSGVLMLGNLPPLESQSTQMNISMNATVVHNYHDTHNEHDDRYENHDNYDDGYDDMHSSPIPKESMANTNVLTNHDIPSENHMEDINFIRSNLNTTKNGILPPKLHGIKKKTKVIGDLLDPHKETTDSRPVTKGISYRIPKSLQNVENLDSNNKSKNKDNFYVNFQKYIKEQIHKPFGTGSNSWDMDKWFSLNDDDRTKLPLSGYLIPSFAVMGRKLRHRQHMEEMNDIEEDYIFRDPIDDHDYDQVLIQNRSLRSFSSSTPKNISFNDEAINNHDNNDDMGDWDNNINDNNDNDNSNNEYQHVNSVVDVPINIQLTEDEEEMLLARRVDKILSEELNSSVVSSYKMICDKMILDFKRGLEQYAKETNLSRRVTDWTNRMEPILQQQEFTSSFDIHDYSDRILAKVNRLVHSTSRRTQSSKDSTKPFTKDIIQFDEIIMGKNHSSSEVCRIFLACLQLANMGNLLVIPPTKEGRSDLKPFVVCSSNHDHSSCVFNESFGVKLLDTTKKIDVENYAM